MRIVFTIGSLSGGGAERVVSRLASQMAKEGHNIYVLLIAQDKVSYTVDERVKIIFVKPKINVVFVRYITRLLRYRSLVNEIKPDVVISFTVAVNMFVLTALRWMNIKIILSERNNPYVDPKSASSRRRRDKNYLRADGFVFQTEDARDYFSEEIRDKSTIIINPVDSNVPLPYEGIREKIIVTAARLEPQKNQQLLVDAFAEIAENIPEYKLHIYGTGSLHERLQNQIDRLGMKERIELKGYCDNVLEKIKDAALFVLPSDYEGISNSLLEALAIGLPVISTNHPIGGARLLIKNYKNGVLTKVGDKEELKDRILELTSSRELSSELAKEAVKIREIAGIENISNQWMNFIISVCQS